MTDDVIKLGDEVQLKSNGLKMTVVRVNGNEITTAWFDKNAELHHEIFTPEMLKHSEDSYFHLRL